jgi:hypothetical protein
MSKLFKLRDWLTLDEAAAHISTVLGEPATVADLYRLALDRYLTLSVDFVNHTYARKGEWLKSDQIEFRLVENDIFTGDKLDIPYSHPSNYEIRVSEDDWITLEEPVVSIKGVWDLPMVGAEQLDIEHDYQQLTSGLEVTLTILGGVFVQQGDVVCQLQTDFDDNEYQKGSKAQKKDLEKHIAINDIGDDEEKKLRAEFKADREKYLGKRENVPREQNYFPSGGLAEHDYALVIRTNEITRFIQSLEDTPATEKLLSSKERNSLLVLIGALCKEVEINPSKRGVAASLVAMTEILGAPLTDDTIRKILGQIEGAVSARNK